ncbi:hypothetical protein K503DRAFT_21029 [Rhizopogon vinicolor AM-OR11-026]|uniref:Cytochrome P450 n=1 Tax=Rhizopogon vinicolor AM-OR11-026 TaxID=1314800 RepID=A0A1B7MHL7_9AGAM|nr:hypothetical protein K503DRAFT_21029 [Rhizopogon vinicolor AM-OR11-026]
MTLYPHVQEKAHILIESMVGTNRLPTFQNRPSLPYIDAIVRITNRLPPEYADTPFTATTTSTPEPSVKHDTRPSQLYLPFQFLSLAKYFHSSLFLHSQRYRLYRLLTRPFSFIYTRTTRPFLSV